MDMPPAPKTATIENRTFDEIKAGDSASIIRTLTEADIELFAVVSGDVNPAHLDPVYAKTDLFHRVVAHGMWGGGLISAVLGTKLPGPGTVYLSQSLRFLAPIGVGDTITTTVTAREKQIERHRITFDCRCVNQGGHEVITGVAEVRAPVEQLRQDRMELPDVQLARHRRFRDLLALATGHPPVPGRGRLSVRRAVLGRGGGSRGSRAGRPYPGWANGENSRGRGGGQGRHRYVPPDR